MYLIHPVMQLAATLLALYVLKLGVARFRRLHVQQATTFNWKRHVLLGKTATGLWFFGLLLGLATVRGSWHGLLITGAHGVHGLYILPILCIGVFTGLYMDKRKKQRLLLPLIHAGANLLVLAMAFLQAASGWQVYNAFVLGN